MALSGRQRNRRESQLWDISDPFEILATLLDNNPASSYVRDATAVASTNVDWKEVPTEHVFKVDLPGVRKEDVKVEIEGDRTLSVSGQRQKEEVQKGDTWHLVERTSGTFLRKFRLPKSADLERIQAKVDNGVLTVVVPKVEKKSAQKRAIEIHGGESGPPQNITATHEDKQSQQQSQQSQEGTTK